MSDLVAAREALIIEAIGEAADLIDAVDRLNPLLRENGREIAQASAGLNEALTAFESRIIGLTEKAKVEAVKHIIARTDEAARRSIEEQRQAMREAAREAFGVELGPTLQQLQSNLRPLIERTGRVWETWLTHAAAAVTASVFTWALTVWRWAG